MARERRTPKRRGRPDDGRRLNENIIKISIELNLFRKNENINENEKLWGPPGDEAGVG